MSEKESTPVIEEAEESGPVHRVQLDFSHKGYKRLLEIKEHAGSDTKAELIRDALRVFGWLLIQRDAGKSLKLVTSEGQEERVEILF